MDYFKKLEGQDGWIAIGQEDCTNQRYFTVFSKSGEKIGIFGVYDHGDDKNITHTVIDPEFRGQGLSGKLKPIIMDKLNLDYLTLTIDLDNHASIKAAEKIPGIKKVSDQSYEDDFHKVKYILEKDNKQY